MKKLIPILGVILLMPLALGLISTGYKHTSDYYAVTFDSEGDAIVSAQLTIENTEQKALEQITLEFPREVIFYEVVQKAKGRTCRRYYEQTQCETWGEDGNCEKYTSERHCEYWIDQGLKYIKVNTSQLSESVMSEATTLRIDLPKDIDPGETSTLVISYKINDYATSGLSYDFDFETIIDNQASRIESVRVSVNVIEDYVLKGGDAEVEHKDYDFLNMQKMVAEDSYGTASYDRYSTAIRRASGFVKSTEHLDPSESFHVKGTYADSWWKLHITGLLVSLIVFGVLIFGFIHLAKTMINFRIKKDTGKKTSKEASTDEHPAFESILVGFSSAFLMLIFTVVGFLITTLVHKEFYTASILLSLLVFMFVGLINLALLIVPGIIVGKRHEALYGLLTFGSTVVLGALMAAFVLIFLIAVV